MHFKRIHPKMMNTETWALSPSNNSLRLAVDTTELFSIA